MALADLKVATSLLGACAILSDALRSLPTSVLHNFFVADCDSSFATDIVINHDDLVDIDVHAIAMYTMVDGGFVHDAEPLTRVCGEASWMCQYLGISEALTSTIILGSLLSAPRKCC